jgi:hypothetical protein
MCCCPEDCDAIAGWMSSSAPTSLTRERICTYGGGGGGGLGFAPLLRRRDSALTQEEGLVGR